MSPKHKEWFSKAPNKPLLKEHKELLDRMSHIKYPYIEPFYDAFMRFMKDK